MLTLAEIQDILADYSYKPGWTFQAGEHPREGHMVRIEASVPDSSGEADIVLGINSWLPPIPDSEYLYEWVRWRLTRIELHELAEFLKIGGNVIDDPHRTDCPWEQHVLACDPPDPALSRGADCDTGLYSRSGS